MARRELGPAALRVASAVAAALPAGDLVVGCSGGADSTALALGAGWAARRTGASVRVTVVDHGLQPGSAVVAAQVADRLTAAGLRVEVRRVEVTDRGEGIEAAARDARLAALAEPGLPVLLGHTLDDQAESVLLGLLRGSGTRSLAGMASVRGPFHRPLLGVRRADTAAACRDWGIAWWADPMNQDPAFARVRTRAWLADASAAFGRDLAPALARTAALARADADLLDDLAADVAAGEEADAAAVGALPDALRGRVLLAWLRRHGVAADAGHVAAVDTLLGRWRGQGPIAVPGGTVRRHDGLLLFEGSGAPGAGEGPAR